MSASSEVLFHIKKRNSRSGVPEKVVFELFTIRNCDRIIVLDKGRVIEEGTYEALIRKEGFFAGLVKRQQLAEA